MYTKPFFITEPLSNHAFSFERRKEHPEGVLKLFVPSIKDGTFLDLREGNEVVFQEFDDEGKLQTCSGLQSFIRTSWRNVPAVIFDNHNHAFFFWHEARKHHLIENGATLIHIDQHSDMREPERFLSPKFSNDLRKVFDYTHSFLNVGNFIRPAKHTHLVGEIIQVTGLISLRDLLGRMVSLKEQGNIILDLDVDFFAQEDIAKHFDEVKDSLHEIASRASFITIATSPFFIRQKEAIDFVKRVFAN